MKAPQRGVKTNGATEKDIKAEYHDGLLEIHVPAGATEMPAPPTAKQIPSKTTGGKTKAA